MRNNAPAERVLVCGEGLPRFGLVMKNPGFSALHVPAGRGKLRKTGAEEFRPEGVAHAGY